VPRNDPTDTGGLFVGRRPGTAPVRYRGTPVTAGEGRKRADSWFGHVILVAEVLLCVTLWGPQPLGWLWVGSHVKYWTDSVELGITSAFAGMILTLFLTLVVLKRLDHAWILVRRAAGFEQREGILERIFVISLAISVSAFLFWFFIIEGPGPSLAPRDGFA
jgi:hypothetical protein